MDVTVGLGAELYITCRDESSYSPDVFRDLSNRAIELVKELAPVLTHAETTEE